MTIAEDFTAIKKHLVNIGSVAAHSCPTKTKQEVCSYIEDQAFEAFKILFCLELALKKEGLLNENAHRVLPGT